MDRRAFLAVTGQGIGMLGLAPLSSCRSTAGSSEGDGSAIDGHAAGDLHLVFEPDGELLVLDPTSHRVLDLDAADEVERELGSLGAADGELNHPIDAAFDGRGDLYVLDCGNRRVQVFSSEGAHLRSFACGEGLPRDLHVSGERVYVCDTSSHVVRVFDLDGRPVATVGGSGDGLGGLNGPRALAIASDGELHVVDAGSASVVVFTASGEPVRRYGRYGSGPGGMLSPSSIAIDASGRAYVADPAAGYVHVFTADGAFVGRFRPEEDGAPAVPARLTLRPDGLLYVWTAGLEPAPTAGE